MLYIYLSLSKWLASLSMMISRFIHVAASDISSIFYGWVIFIHAQSFIHSSVDEHLGCFMSWLLSAVLLWTLGCIYLLGLEFSLTCMSRSGIAGSYDSSIFNFSKELFSIVTAPIYIPTNRVEGLCFLHTL